MPALCWGSPSCQGVQTDHVFGCTGIPENLWVGGVGGWSTLPLTRSSYISGGWGGFLCVRFFFNGGIFLLCAAEGVDSPNKSSPTALPFRPGGMAKVSLFLTRLLPCPLPLGAHADHAAARPPAA